MRYLWHHGIEELQDAVIEAGMTHMRKTTGAIIDRHTMLKIIIMKYGEDLQDHMVGMEPENRIAHSLLGEVEELAL